MGGSKGLSQYYSSNSQAEHDLQVDDDEIEELEWSPMLDHHGVDATAGNLGPFEFFRSFYGHQHSCCAAWIYWLDDIIQQLIVKEEGGFLWHRHQLLESLQLMTPL